MYSITVNRPSRLELVTANLSLGCTLIAAVWKIVGCSYIPGFEEAFGGKGAQYPRNMNTKHNSLYFAMYGVLGCIAQYCNNKITYDKSNRKNNRVNKTTQRRAQIFGLFHSIIATHHILWSFVPGWGRLTLAHLNAPGLYTAVGFISIGCGIHGLKLLTTKEGGSLKKVLRSKIALDLVTFSTFVELLFFIPANWYGYRNDRFEKYVWLLSMLAPIPILIASAFGDDNDDNDDADQELDEEE